MTFKVVIDISVKYGWEVSFTHGGDSFQLHFRRTTLSGMPFCFSIGVKEGRSGEVCREIISFVDALYPERCVMKWLVKSRAVSPPLFDLAVADMEDIRRKAWLLACALEVPSSLVSALPSC